MPTPDPIYKRLERKYLAQINALERELIDLSENALQTRALKLKGHVYTQLADLLAKSDDDQIDLLTQSKQLMIDTLPEAFALVREVSRRLLGMRHYDVQMIAGISLHLGNITELKTGEGKTIVALLAAYLNGLFASADYTLRSASNKRYRKRNVHLMTTNDYLARRDYTWLKPVYSFLGVTVGYLQEISSGNSSYRMGLLERQAMYASDIVYGAAHEFIFDYLRDNAAETFEKQVQGSHFFVIVDEVDHLLLDEAQTPHILQSANLRDRNQDVNLVYMASHYAYQMIAHQHIIEVESNAVRVSPLGSELLRIISHDLVPMLKRSGNPRTKDFVFVYTLLFQIIQLHVIHTQMDIDPGIIDIVARISRTLSPYNLVEFSEAKNGIMLNAKGRNTIQNYLIDIIDRLPPDDGNIEILLGIIRRLIGMMFNHGSTMLARIFAEYGITIDDIIIFRNRLSTILIPTTLQGFIGLFSRDKSKFSSIITDILIELVEDFIYDLPETSLQNTEQVIAMLQNLSLLLSNIWVVREVRPQINALREYVFPFDIKFNDMRLTTDAFANIVEQGFVPIIANTFYPHSSGPKKSRTLLFIVLAFRILREAGNIKKPQNSYERELVSISKEIAKTLSNRFFDYDPVSKHLSLTRWGTRLVDDYSQRIVASMLWVSQTGLHSHKQNTALLKPKLNFLIRQSLRAHLDHHRDNEYVLQRATRPSYDTFTGRWVQHEIVIVGDLTGRIMVGRRWHQWLHAFIEAKEGLPVKRETEEMGRISTQSYIQRYSKHAGMSGTVHVGSISPLMAFAKRAGQLFRSLSASKTETNYQSKLQDFDPVKAEFEDTYGSPVVVIPENRLSIRKDIDDLVFLNQEAKLHYLVNQVLDEIYPSGQPVLIETTSVEQSKQVYATLEEQIRSRGMQARISLLNALSDEQEAEIVTKAGFPYTITVSTQMAGRGTDIVVTKEALEVGGLFVIGYERRDSRRWDDQIRGRTGRQGEPGMSQFYMSTDAELLQRYNMENAQALLARFNIGDEPIQAGMLTNVIRENQIALEHYARERRQSTSAFDHILGKYRTIMYALRQATFDLEYICPICRQLEQSIAIDDEHVFCFNCSTALQKNATQQRETFPMWRSDIHYFINLMIDRVLDEDKLEKYLVKRYTADTSSPSAWAWQDIVAELNQYLEHPSSVRSLQAAVDFKNEWYPEAERPKLIEAIRQILVSDAQQRILDRTNTILDAIRRGNDKTMLPARIQELTQELALHFALRDEFVAARLEQAIHGQTSIPTIVQHLRHSILTLIERETQTYEWLNLQTFTWKKLSDLFNTLLDGDQIKFDENQDTMTDRTIKSIIINALSPKYNQLIQKFHKRKIYAYENDIIRAEIDRYWTRMLTETTYISDDLADHGHKDDVIVEYGVRIAQLFDQIVQDMARQIVQQIFTCDSVLTRHNESVQQPQRKSFRLSGFDSCPCGSTKPFHQCCGSILYSF